jgi:hypothetical protein
MEKYKDKNYTLSYTKPEKNIHINNLWKTPRALISLILITVSLQTSIIYEQRHQLFSYYFGNKSDPLHFGQYANCAYFIATQQIFCVIGILFSLGSNKYLTSKNLLMIAGVLNIFSIGFSLNTSEGQYLKWILVRATINGCVKGVSMITPVYLLWRFLGGLGARFRALVFGCFFAFVYPLTSKYWFIIYEFTWIGSTDEYVLTN